MATGDKIVTLDGLKAVYDSQDTDSIKQDVADLKSSVEQLGETYAKQDGYYQDMAVGAADQVISSKMTEDSAPYKFRTSGGSADIGNRAYMDKIVGGTVAFNQLSMERFTSAGGTLTQDGDVFTYTATTVGAADYNNNVMVSNQPSIPAGHKLFLTAQVKPSKTKTIGIFLLKTSSSGSNTSFSRTCTQGVWNNVSGMLTVPTVSGATYGRMQITFNITSATGGAVGDTEQFKNVMLFDLTQMFGSTVADYIYTLEQSTAGAGVALFRSLFPDPYYEYNAGELISVEGLQSHDTVGFNAWDEEWEVGGINDATGQNLASVSQTRSKNYVRILPSTAYYFYVGKGTALRVFFYDADKNFISYVDTGSAVTTTPSNAHYLRFRTFQTYGTTYLNDICINLSWSGSRNGEYEAYKKHSYPLDSSLILRGVPKLDSSNKLYWDGDEYAPDGTVTRRYTFKKISDIPETRWSYDSTNAVFSINIDFDGITSIPADTPSPAMIEGYTTYPSGYNTSFASNDRAVWMHVSSGTLRLTDSRYTTISDIRTALADAHIIYQLATPTTETADAYQQIQNVDDYGTEEFVSTSIIPVGHVTRYPANLRDKLQHLPDLAASDGTYVILQSGSQMTLAPLTTPTELPAAPSANGTYTLKATVSNGAVTYSWGA